MWGESSGVLAGHTAAFPLHQALFFFFFFPLFANKTHLSPLFNIAMEGTRESKHSGG